MRNFPWRAVSFRKCSAIPFWAAGRVGITLAAPFRKSRLTPAPPQPSRSAPRRAPQSHLEHDVKHARQSASQQLLGPLVARRSSQEAGAHCGRIFFGAHVRGAFWAGGRTSWGRATVSQRSLLPIEHAMQLPTAWWPLGTARYHRYSRTTTSAGGGRLAPATR